MDFPFDILDVVHLLNLPKGHLNPSSLDMRCPFCDDRGYHLNVNLQKQVWRCNRCGEHGGILDLYARVLQCSRKEAYHDILEQIQGCPQNNSESVQTMRAIIKKNRVNNVPVAPLEIRNHTYHCLLDILLLLKEDQEDLLRRGLSEKEIIRLEYRSIPSEDEEFIIQELLQQGCCLEGVPGFYFDGERYHINIYPQETGYFIPVRDASGMVQGMQIRRRIQRMNKNGKKQSRYYWFSSRDKENGTAAVSCVHYAGMDCLGTKIYLTEGALKADASHYFSGAPFLALSGVGMIQALVREIPNLKQLGIQEIVDATDMDKFEKEQVFKQTELLRKLIQSEGFHYSQLLWDGNYKGIDDFLLHCAIREQNKHAKAIFAA